MDKSKNKKYLTSTKHQTERNNYQSVLNQALLYFRRGDLVEAQKKLIYILNLQPQNLAALEILGAVFVNLGDVQQAFKQFDKITKIKPDYPEAWSNRGFTLSKLKRYEAALASYEKAINLKPSFVDAWCNRGNAFAELKKYDQALDSFENVVAIAPDHADAWSNRGNALLKLKHYEKALASFKKAISIRPAFFEAWSNLGNTFVELKKYDDAIATYDKAIDIKPTYPTAWYNRGNALADLSQYEQALVSFDKAIDIKPDYGEAWYNRGCVLLELKRFEQALASCDKAISIKPDSVEAWCNRGNALRELRQYDQAFVSYDNAIRIKPDYVDAWRNRGQVHMDLKQYEQALVSFEKAISIKPDYEFCFGQKLHSQMHLCKWEDLESQLKTLSKKILAGKPVSHPFSTLSLLDKPEVLKKAAENYLQAKYPPLNHSVPFPKKDRSQRIRIGYYSADFVNHAMSSLMAELFEVHDRSQFEIFGFSFGPNKQDEMRRRVSAGVDCFHEVSRWSDHQIVELSRSLGIDIAIDLMGFTAGSRTGIFSKICAPIQVSYLGYPGTMAAPYIEYLVADPVVIPSELQKHYSEKIVYLPDCYQVNDSKRKISQKEFTREEFGLPDDQFVFCCFNNNHKILPQTFDSWMRILKSVKGSVLWLLQSNTLAAANLRKEATARGVDKSRLIFAKPMNLDEHLARHRLADLFLDTLPYNAHTTASDALWAGLPVLTQIGHSFAARVAASLLSTMQLEELITQNANQYESLAIELAKDPSKLNVIRRQLEINHKNSALFNARLFARHIEKAYSIMFERYHFGEKPEHIYL